MANFLGNPNTVKFSRLFRGLDVAYGTGEGRWVKEKPRLALYSEHVAGHGPGLGIAPLMDDGNVWFAAIDLDEPNFALARDLQTFLPGNTWIERSRSGNAHVWVFFSAPVEAWVARGILREALAAYGRKNVEVFPKQDRLRIGMVGNYINLPYHGDQRPVLRPLDEVEYEEDVLISPSGHPDLLEASRRHSEEFEFHEFVERAWEERNDPEDWRKRARWLGVPSLEEREHESAEWGEQPILHKCAEWILEHRESNPVMEGHRAVVYFCLAKQFANCNQYSADEALSMMGLVNDASPDPIPEAELRRIYFNAERGQFTSTGCDDPLFHPYAHPDCHIAHGR